MSQIATQSRLSESVRRQLDAVRRAIRTYIALDGMLLAMLWGLSIFWLGGILDYFPVKLGSNETPTWLRATMLAALVAGVAWALLWRAGRRYFARLPDRSLAVLVERRFPDLNCELVTAVELVGQSEQDVSNPTAYRAMLDRVHRTVSSRVGSLPAFELLNWQPIWNVGVASGLLAFVSILGVVGMPTWMNLWAQRLFMLSSEGWPRRAALRAEGVQLQLPAFTGQLAADRVLLTFRENVARVPRGSATTLQISADASADEVPSLCTLFYSGSDGSRGRANMRRVGGAQSGWQMFTLDGPPLDGLSNDLEFDIIGSDARLRDFRLETVDPAVVNAVELECRYPLYLLDSLSSRPSSERLVYRSGLVIPEGSDVTLHGTASSGLSLVQYVLHGASAKSVAEATPSVEIHSCQPIGNQFSIPLGVLRSSLIVEVRLLDRFGLAADQIPRYVLNVAEDAVPEVETRLAGIGSAITSRAILPIKGTVKDDYRLSRLWAELSRNDMDPLPIDLLLTVDNKVDATIDLLQLREQRGVEIKTDSTLGLMVSAQDRYDLDGGKHVGLGQPQQLAVVVDDKLLVILDRQELELRQRLELIIAELNQLRDALTELSKLKRDPAATDDEQVQQLQRLASLRAQQSVLQGDKSQQELLGIAKRTDDIRQQLVNNRIDSRDRQERLQKRVYEPLTSALDNEMEELRKRLSELQSATSTAEGGAKQASDAIDSLIRLLAALEEIKANMMDIESYNEIVDLVRGLLDDEERLLDETQKLQKKQILDILNQPQP